MPSNHLILCPLLLPPSIIPSIRVFSNEAVLHIGSQSIGASASASVLPVNIQDWFPLRWTGLISLQWTSAAAAKSLQSCPTLATAWTPPCQASLLITNYQSLLKLMSNESVMPSNHLILCRPLLLPPSIFPSVRVFSNESVLHIRWPKYWNFSFSISPSNEYSGLISFTMDWLELLAVQGTLKSSPTRLCFLICCLGWSYLLFQGVSIFFSFHGCSRHLNSGAQKNKFCHCFHCFPIHLPWSDGTRCHDLSFLNVEF